MSNSIENIESLLAELSPSEREETLKILNEFVNNGNSAEYKNLIYKDYDEIPVDIRTFVLSKQYLGNSWDENNTVYPFWLETLENIFNKGKVFNECLTGDTLIQLSDGTEDNLCNLCKRVNSGEQIFVNSFNLDTNKYEQSLISIGKNLGKKDVYKVLLSNGKSVLCTKNHKFLMSNGKYKRADELQTNEEFLQPADNSECIKFISIEKYNTEEVYDIEVPENHNFALSCGIYSSNCIFTGSIGAGKTTAAVLGFAYVLYQMMCLRNPNEYYGLPPKDTITFSMFNVTLDLVEKVAYAEFTKHVKISPWFNEHGTWIGRGHTARYQPNKNINIVIGSKDQHTLGQHVFCLDGDTLVKCLNNNGNDEFVPIKDVKNKFIYIYNEYTQKQEIQSNKANSIITKETNELCELQLEDGTVIRLDPEHLILMSDGSYKKAIDIKDGDDILDVK